MVEDTQAGSSHAALFFYCTVTAPHARHSPHLEVLLSRIKFRAPDCNIERGERTTAVHRPSDNALPSYHSGSTAWRSENKQQEN